MDSIFLDSLIQFSQFNIESIKYLVDHQEKNPYNRNELPKNIIDNINTISRLGKILGYKLNIVIDNKIDNLSQEKKIELETLSLFQKIDEFGHITNYKWFFELSNARLIRYIKEIIDIWEYRAQFFFFFKQKTAYEIVM